MTKESRSTRLSRREAISLLGVGAGLGLISTLRGGGGLLADSLQQTSAAVTFPKGAIIRTILKDVAPEALAGGMTFMHEHLSMQDPPPPWLPPANPPRAPWPGVDVIVEDVRKARKAGITCIVDGGTTGLGRSVEHVREVATKVASDGMHIVLGGGLYLGPRYPLDVAKKTEDQLVADFDGQAKAERWGALGEIGTSMEMLPDEAKVLRAVSKFHVRTGLPIFSHTPHEGCAKCALDQLDIFEKQGVNLRSLCIGHMADIRDDLGAATHKAVAKRGAFVGFDTVGRFTGPMGRPAEHVKMIMAFLEAGYEDHALFSMDGRTGLEIVTLFLPELRKAGVKEATLHKIAVDNPRRFLAFVPKQSA